MANVNRRIATAVSRPRGKFLIFMPTVWELCTIRGGERSTPLRRCSVHAVNAAFEDDNHAFAEREVIGKLRVLLQQGKIFVATKAQRSFGKTGFRFELGVSPHLVKEIECLAGRALHCARKWLLLQLRSILLFAGTFALLDRTHSGIESDHWRCVHRPGLAGR